MKRKGSRVRLFVRLCGTIESASKAVLTVNATRRSKMAIRYKRLGKHGALVSNLCLGTMNFGWVTPEEESFQIMDRALELGINFFDTADVYSWPRSTARPRRSSAAGSPRAGAARGRHPGHEGLQPRHPQGQPAGAERGWAQPLRREDLKHCAGSLKRLQTDWIDLYRCTTWTGSAPGTRSGRPSTRSSSRARWPTSAPATSPAGTSPRRARKPPRGGLTGLVSEQSIYHLNNRMIELEVIPACRH